MEDNKNTFNNEDNSSIKSDFEQGRNEAVKEVIGNLSSEDTPNADMSLLEELELYVGPKKEAYYSTRFEDIIDTESKFGWHWPALFVPVLWMAYRKMYIEAIALTVISTLLSYFSEASGIFYLASLILTFLVPAMANWLYFRHAKADIEKINSVGEERKSEIIAKGGTSLVAVLIFLVVSIAIAAMNIANDPQTMKLLNLM